MSNIEIILIALGLSMDCFAVSITISATNKNINRNKIIEIALFFGLFQGVMPIFGWLLGLSIKAYIENIDHWIAFGIFLIIGGKMIKESFKHNKKKSLNINKFWILIALAIATSIDAMIVGTSFVFFNISITNIVLIIGTITFLISLLGIFIGKKYGYFCKNRAELIGGVILIGIGTKILLQHLAII